MIYQSFVCACVRSFVRSFVSSFLRSYVRSFVRSFVCSFVRSFVRLFVCLFFRSFVSLFVSSFVCSLHFYTFVCSFVHFFVLTFVCLFVCSFVRFVRSLARFLACSFVYSFFRLFVRSHLGFVSISFVYFSHTLSCVFNRVVVVVVVVELTYLMILPKGTTADLIDGILNQEHASPTEVENAPSHPLVKLKKNSTPVAEDRLDDVSLPL